MTGGNEKEEGPQGNFRGNGIFFFLKLGGGTMAAHFVLILYILCMYICIYYIFIYVCI